MSYVLSVRIKDKLAKQLNKIANETERAKSFHVQKALENYLSEYAELQIAIDRLNDPLDERISAKEMRQMLEI